MNNDPKMVERVAEALANEIAMRNGCPAIKGCLKLMPPHMTDKFREDARAALDASHHAELVDALEAAASRIRGLARAIIREVGLGVCDDELVTLKGIATSIDAALAKIGGEA